MRTHEATSAEPGLPSVLLRGCALAGLALLLLAAPAPAAQQGFGLGIILGSPTGLSMKLWLDGRSALDVAAAWSFEGDGSFQFHGDYLRHRSPALDRAGQTRFYYGLGFRMRLDDENHRDDDSDTHLGMRIPLGISFTPWQDPPLEFFLELAPGLDLTPSTDFFMNGGVGVRYYFR